MNKPSFESSTSGPEGLAEKQRSILERSTPFYRRLSERIATSRLAKAVAGIAMLTATEGCGGFGFRVGGQLQTDWPSQTIAQRRELRETVAASRKVEQVATAKTPSGEIFEREDGLYAMSIHRWVKDGEDPNDHMAEAVEQARKSLLHRGIKTRAMEAQDQVEREQREGQGMGLLPELGPRNNYRGLTVASIEDVEIARAIVRPGLEESRTIDQIHAKYRLESDADGKALLRTARELAAYEPYIRGLSTSAIDASDVKKKTHGFIRSLGQFRNVEETKKLVDLAQKFVEVSDELNTEDRMASMSGVGGRDEREMVFGVVRNQLIQRIEREKLQDIVPDMERLVSAESALHDLDVAAEEGNATKDPHERTVPSRDLQGLPEGTEYVYAVPLILKTSGTSMDRPIKSTTVPEPMDTKPLPSKKGLTEKQKKLINKLYDAAQELHAPRRPEGKPVPSKPKVRPQPRPRDTFGGPLG